MVDNESPEEYTLKGLLQFGLTAEVATEKEAANSSVAFAHYIAASLLNYSTQKNTKPIHTFCVRLTPTETIPIPSHSKLLLQHLSHKMHFNINLFSSRAQPTVFFSHQEACSIAFFTQSRFLSRCQRVHRSCPFIPYSLESKSRVSGIKNEPNSSPSKQRSLGYPKQQNTIQPHPQQQTWDSHLCDVGSCKRVLP
ncbi:MAG: hypothetical protein J3Q66DRAFT_370565 [Benniella sp.]|nr:MAG: hypothetical protein J3Q66DRAFT_370565 [Benniella sp.]